MKKSLMLLIFVNLLSTHAFANDICVAQYGTMKCSTGSIDSINYMGFVDLDGTTVVNNIDIFGTLTARDGNLNNVNVKGESHLAKTLISGTLQSIGRVNSNDLEVIKSTNIVGSFVANHTTLDAPTSIVGMVECESCIFKKDATII